MIMNIDQLKEFCAPPGSENSMLTEPHTIDGITVATDTVIAIRISAIPDGKPIYKYPKLKKILNKIAKNSKSLKPIEIPDFAIPEIKKCPCCHGSGFPNASNEFPQEWCRNCEGSGKIESLIGRPHEIRPISVGDAHFNPYLLIRIYKLPGIKIFPNGMKLPAYFIFDGGDGIIMPCLV